MIHVTNVSLLVILYFASYNTFLFRVFSNTYNYLRPCFHAYCSFLLPHRPLPITPSPLFHVHCPMLVVTCSLSHAHYSMFISHVHWFTSIAPRPMPIVSSPLPHAHCLMPIAPCPLLQVHYQLLHAHCTTPLLIASCPLPRVHVPLLHTPCTTPITHCCMLISPHQ